MSALVKRDGLQATVACAARTAEPYGIVFKDGDSGASALHLYGAARRLRRGRAYRRMVLAAARQREAQRRAERRSDAALIEAWETALWQDTERQRIADTLAQPTVSESLYLRDDGGKVRATVTLSAAGYMVALESLYRDRHSAALAVEACMRAEPHNGGRASLVQRAPNSVNGTEVRGAERWQGSAAQRSEAQRYRLPVALVKRYGATGTLAIGAAVAPGWSPVREALVSSATAAKRKATAGTIGLASSLPPVQAD